MALKDLVANKAALTEEAIEAIVTGYIRYYPDTGEIGFTPAGAELRNDQKVLLYLTAIHGWMHVTDDPPAIATRPADLEKVVGIPGGTLRPLLKSLKEAHLITSNNGAYTVREGNFDAIADIVRTNVKPPAKKRAARTRHNKELITSRRKASGQVTAKIGSWIDSGYFDIDRTLKDVHARLHEQGIIVEQTAVSGPLLRSVQNAVLVRSKQKVHGKVVWTYHTSKSMASQ